MSSEKQKRDALKSAISKLPITESSLADRIQDFGGRHVRDFEARKLADKVRALEQRMGEHEEQLCNALFEKSELESKCRELERHTRLYEERLQRYVPQLDILEQENQRLKRAMEPWQLKVMRWLGAEK